MFRKLHTAYTDLMCNPFYIPGDYITSEYVLAKINTYPLTKQYFVFNVSVWLTNDNCSFFQEFRQSRQRYFNGNIIMYCSITHFYYLFIFVCVQCFFFSFYFSNLQLSIPSPLKHFLKIYLIIVF